MAKNLTSALIERTKCPEGKGYIFLWDAKSEGLGVQITKVGHKSFVFRYVFGSGKKKERRRVISSCNKISLDQARNIANNYSYQLSLGNDPFDKKEKGLTLIDVCREYLEYRCKDNIREKTIAKKTSIDWKSMINGIILKDKISSKKMDDFSVIDANNFMDRHNDRPSSANRTAELLRLVFKYSFKKGYIKQGVNIWESGYLNKFEEKKERKRLNHNFENDNDSEVKKFLQYLSDAKMGLIIDKRGVPIDLSWIHLMELLFFTGARPQEIQNLQEGHIDNVERVAVLPVHKTSNKTGDKIIYFNNYAWKIIEMARLLKAKENRYNNPYVIMGNGVGYLRSYKRQWNRLREETGITAPVYSLRRNFASMGQEYFTDTQKGNELKTVSKIIGHSDEKMTAIYAGENKKVIKDEIQNNKNRNNELGEFLNSIGGVNENED